MATSDSPENLPVDTFRVVKKSAFDMFEETIEDVVNKEKVSFKAKEEDLKKAKIEEKDSVGDSATYAIKYTELNPDSKYKSRPHLPDMDWANCSWADPDDSL